MVLDCVCFAIKHLYSTFCIHVLHPPNYITSSQKAEIRSFLIFVPTTIKYNSCPNSKSFNKHLLNYFLVGSTGINANGHDEKACRQHWIKRQNVWILVPVHALTNYTTLDEFLTYFMASISLSIKKGGEIRWSLRSFFSISNFKIPSTLLVLGFHYYMN